MEYHHQSAIDIDELEFYEEKNNILTRLLTS
jgi:hypothetical protein